MSMATKATKSLNNILTMIEKGTIPNLKDLIDLTATPVSFETKSKRVEDVNEDFKGFMNKFVINNLLQNEENKMRFLNLIAGTFNTVVNDYNKKFNLTGENAVIFLYKGGNLLRIFYKRFLNNFKTDSSINISEIIDEVFAGEFGKSDDDFTILINPKLPNFDKIHADMNYLSYACLEIIRDQLLANREYYFNYFALPQDEKILKLMTSLKTAINDGAFKSLSNPDSPYYGYEIVGILFDDTYSPVPPKNESIDKFLKINQEPDAQFNYLSQLYPIPYPTIESVKQFKKFDADANPEKSKLDSKRNDFFILRDESINLLPQISDPTVRHETNPTNSFIYPSKVRTQNLIYVSHNDIHIDDGGSNGIVSFVLNRSKINALIYLKKSVFNEPDQLVYVSAPGELIDVTIANHNDRGLMYMYEKVVARNLSNYTFNYDTSQFALEG